MGFWEWLRGSSEGSGDALPPVTGVGSTLPQLSGTVSGVPVTPGSTLSELGRDHGFDWASAKIARSGQIIATDPGQIQVGDIVIPRTYAVQPGDTLSEIARDNGFNYNDAQVIRGDKVYDLGEGGIATDQIQPGDEIVPSSEQVSATKPAEQAAEEQGSTSDPEQTEQGCRGWIAVRSHYVNFDLIAVSGQVTISRLKGDQATRVLQETITYTTIATNGLFVSRAPVPRPANPGASQDGTAAADTGAEEAASAPTSQAQTGAVAGANGNPLVLFGGEEGLEPGRYRVTFRPNVRHGKLRIDPRPITQENVAATAADDATMAGRYKIIPTDGIVPDGVAVPWITENTTDQYLQVPADTTVHEEWSQDIAVPCRSMNEPVIVEFQWADFDAAQERSNLKIRTLHPYVRHRFFTLVNKVEEMTAETIWRVDQGYRTIAEQDGLYAIGRTVQTGRSTVTNARGGSSNHNYALAIDIYRVTDRGIDDNAPYATRVVPVADRLGFEWGGRWTTFKDIAHFQDTYGFTIQQLFDRWSSGLKITYDGAEYVDVD